MDELFTVNVYQAKDSLEEGSTNDHGADSNALGRFQNMTSARIIKGRILELEHSNIVSPSVKFKTVVNYERTLEPGSYMGVSFVRQEGYIS